ncbi:MAG: hypothetical protein ACOYB2_19730 [Limnohabitans sp.]
MADSRLDERLLEAADTFDRPMGATDEAMSAIEIALDLAGGSWDRAADLIVASQLISSEASAMAVETLTQER